MNILIQGTTILAVNVTDAGDSWMTPDQIIPKSVVLGSAIVDAILPTDFAPSCYTYANGVFTKIPPTQAALSACCNDCCAAVDALFLKKLYTDISCVFPAGTKIVQFRNDGDRANLVNISQQAQYLISLGTPTATVKFRTKDNVWQILAASDFMAIANYIFDAKQAIKKAATDRKDVLMALMAAGDLAGMKAYDITTGW